jgi:hypothetical protein
MRFVRLRGRGGGAAGSSFCPGVVVVTCVGLLEILPPALQEVFAPLDEAAAPAWLVALSPPLASPASAEGVVRECEDPEGGHEAKSSRGILLAGVQAKVS